MPAPLTSLVGREDEAAAAVALLRGAGRAQPVRLLTLIGPGGVGKTRLALRVAGDLQADFADSVSFVSLAPITDPDLVGPAIESALGVRQVADQPVGDRLASFLAPRQLLLVLDNLEQVVEAAPLVAALLGRCPDLAVLATSRVPLRITGEHRFQVSTLPVPDQRRPNSAASIVQVGAVQLFVDRARSVDPAFTLTDANAPAVAAICGRLDGLPLAIELAAARSSLFSPMALLTRLEWRLPQLTGGPRDQPARLQTMRAAIAWSYDLLTPEEQRVFRYLSVFAGGCTLEAAEAVCESPGDVVDSLANQSLVQVVKPLDNGVGGATRIVMLETIREYARERLAVDEAAEARRRHAAVFLALAEACLPYMEGPAESAWIDRLDADRDNFRAALAWSEEQGEAEIGLRLITALHFAWHARGRVTETRTWIERLLALPGVDAAPPATRAAALSVAAWFAVIQFDLEQAAAHGEEAVRLARLARQPLPLARALIFLGVAYQGFDPERARVPAEEAVTLLRRLDHPAWLPLAVGNLGVVMRELGDLPTATVLFEEQVALEQARGHARGVARAHVDLGDVAWDRGDAREAAAHYRQALAGFQTGGDLTYAAICLNWLCLMADDLPPRTAARLLGAAEAQREVIGLPVEAFAEEGYNRVVAQVRADLGEAACEAAWVAGRALSLDKAIAEMLAPFERESARPLPSLTRREREILAGIVAGQSNRQIAGELFVSYRTVEYHVSNLLAKLGVASRAEAAAWAKTRG